MACSVTRSAADLSVAVAVVATVVTVRVDTDDVTLVRARRVVPPASSTLNCEKHPEPDERTMCKDQITNLILAVVVSAVAAVPLPHLKSTRFPGKGVCMDARPPVFLYGQGHEGRK